MLIEKVGPFANKFVKYRTYARRARRAAGVPGCGLAVALRSDSRRRSGAWGWGVGLGVGRARGPGGTGLLSPIGPSREIVLPCPTRYQTAYYKTTHPDLGLIAPGFFGGRGATSRASEVAL